MSDQLPDNKSQSLLGEKTVCKDPSLDEQVGLQQMSIEDEGRAIPEKQSLGHRIKESANQIWLAGLGAYAQVEKGGDTFFNALVKDGEEVDRKNKMAHDKQAHRDSLNIKEGQEPSEINSDAFIPDASKQPRGNPLQARIDQHISNYRGLVEERVEEVKDRASSSWEKLEKAFDERVAKALSRLNIPTKGDVEVLTARVDQLSNVLEQLSAVAEKDVRADQASHQNSDDDKNKK